MDTKEDIELYLMKQAINKSDEIKHKKLSTSKDIKNILAILEDYLKKKDLLCYGGTAINNILPKKYQFYDYNVDIPDYDIYSENALHDSKEIADIYFSKGYTNVYVRPAINIGTYKISVNFVYIVDITTLKKELFNELKKDMIILNEIKYTPPNYLRMSMYMELSRPMGDTSRWEKVFKRLSLLNKHYPIKNSMCNVIEKNKNVYDENLYNILTDIFIDNKLVFIGDYAALYYGKYMTNMNVKKINQYKNKIEVLSENIVSDIKMIKNELIKNNYENIKIIEREPISDIIQLHYEIKVNGMTTCIIYKTEGCYNYNEIKHDNKLIRIATTNTIITFLLANIYSGRPYYNNDNIICTAEFIFNIMMKKLISNKGLLKRFSIDCIGNEESLLDKLEEKSKLFEILKKDKLSPEYKKLFFKYNPNDKNELDNFIKLAIKDEIQKKEKVKVNVTKKKRNIKKKVNIQKERKYKKEKNTKKKRKGI